MTKTLVTISAATIAIYLSSGLSAAYYSGKGVIANCGSDTPYDNGWCAGYLGSWADGDIDMVRRKACIPSDTSIGTLKAVLIEYAEANPKDVEEMSGGELLQRDFSKRGPTDSTDDTLSQLYRKPC